MTIGDVLGEGCFGQVRKAYCTGLASHPNTPVVVAVKQLKPDATEQELADLVQEMNTMKSIEQQHVNLINLLGACTQNGKCVCIHVLRTQ